MTGKQLNKIWNVGAKQSYYSERGNWFTVPTKFPAALFDSEGFFFIQSRELMEKCPFMNVGKTLNVDCGISNIPGYIKRA